MRWLTIGGDRIRHLLLARRYCNFSTSFCRGFSFPIQISLREEKCQLWMRRCALSSSSHSYRRDDTNKQHQKELPPGIPPRSPFFVRLLFPYESACTILSDSEMKDAIVNFSQQTGVVFTLLASISAGGLFLESLAPLEGIAAAASCSLPSASSDVTGWELYSITNLAHYYFNLELQPFLFKLAAPCFCASTFFNLYGLVNTTNVLGRSQVIPTRCIKDYVLKNSWIVHSSYWALIPAIGTFGLGVVCAVGHLYGEPVTTFSACSFMSVTILQTRHLISLGNYTEQVVADHNTSKRYKIK